MIKSFDHCTIVVKDIEAAKKFFALLGFQEDFSVVISGDRFSAYMGVDNIEAEHVTLVLTDSSPRQEIQLLQYHRPTPISDPNITRLDKVGYNHLCFAVDDIEQEVRRLKEKGVKFLNEIMEFKNRKLTFFHGPEGVTLELSERQS
jgi:catechol 2,3-dioxygenase-like lactoylglutathione lyase family enzyme